MSACQRCGAALAIPPELHVMTVRCAYCGIEQPVPDMLERQRAWQQQQFQAQAQAQMLAQMQSAQNTGRGIQKMVFLFVGLIFVVVIVFTVAIMARSFGGALGE